MENKFNRNVQKKSAFIYLIRNLNSLNDTFATFADFSVNEINKVISEQASRFTTYIKVKVLKANNDYEIKHIVGLTVENLRLCQLFLAKIETNPKQQIVVCSYLKSYHESIEYFEKEYYEYLPQKEETVKPTPVYENIFPRIFKGFGMLLFNEWIKEKSSKSDIAYAYRKMITDELIHDNVGVTEFVEFLYDNNYVDSDVDLDKLKTLDNISPKGRQFKYETLLQLYSKE